MPPLHNCAPCYFVCCALLANDIGYVTLACYLCAMPYWCAYVSCCFSLDLGFNKLDLQKKKSSSLPVVASYTRLQLGWIERRRRTTHHRRPTHTQRAREREKLPILICVLCCTGATCARSRFVHKLNLQKNNNWGRNICKQGRKQLHRAFQMVVYLVHEPCLVTLDRGHS